MDSIYVPPFRSKITSSRTQSYTDGRDDLRGCNLLIKRWPLHCKSCSLWDKFLVLSVIHKALYIKKKNVANCVTKKASFLFLKKKIKMIRWCPIPFIIEHVYFSWAFVIWQCPFPPCFLSLFACLSVIIHCIIVQSLVQTDSHRNVCDRWLFRLDTHINTQKPPHTHRSEKQTDYSQSVPLLFSFFKKFFVEPLKFVHKRFSFFSALSCDLRRFRWSTLAITHR